MATTFPLPGHPGRRPARHAEARSDVVAAAGRMPHAHTAVLPGSHFLPVELPEPVSAALAEPARRCDPAPVTR